MFPLYSTSTENITFCPLLSPANASLHFYTLFFCIIIISKGIFLVHNLPSHCNGKKQQRQQTTANHRHFARQMKAQSLHRNISPVRQRRLAAETDSWASYWHSYSSSTSRSDLGFVFDRDGIKPRLAQTECDKELTRGFALSTWRLRCKPLGSGGSVAQS